LAGRLREGRGNRGRESVILDAADEAIWKAIYHRQAHRSKRKEIIPFPESLRSSMDSLPESVSEERLEKEREM